MHKNAGASRFWLRRFICSAAVGCCCNGLVEFIHGAGRSRAGALMSGGLLEQELFDEAEIGLGVDSDGVVVRGLDVQVQAVFEAAELLEAFGALEPACRQGREEVERSLARS